MTNEAQKHLDKAASYAEKGEAFYRKAAEEIIAARAADPSLSFTEIGDKLGRSKSWAQRIVAFGKSPANTVSSTTPWEDHKAIDARKARQVLREAPLEQIEQMIEDLPEERREAVAAAVGNAYAKERQANREEIRHQTPAKKKEIEAAQGAIGESWRRGLAGFTALGIVAHIEQAADEMAELNADHSVTDELLEQIGTAFARLTEEIEVARMMVGTTN